MAYHMLKMSNSTVRKAPILSVAKFELSAKTAWFSFAACNFSDSENAFYLGLA